jgi:hypothetical protein
VEPKIYLSSLKFTAPKVQIKDSEGKLINYSSKRVYFRTINFLVEEISLQYYGSNLSKIRLLRLAIQYQSSLIFRNFKLGFAELFWVHCLELDIQGHVSLPIHISNSVNSKRVWISRTGVLSGVFANNLSAEIEWDRLRKFLEIEYFVWKFMRSHDGDDKRLYPEMTGPFFLEDSTPEGTREYKKLLDCWVISGQFAFERTKVHYLDKSNRIDQVSRPTNHLFEIDGSLRALITKRHSVGLDHAIMFGSSSSWFHFLVEILPRFLEFNPADMLNSHLLVRGELPGTIREVLSKFHFKSQVYLHDGEIVQVRNLLTVTDLKYAETSDLILRIEELNGVRDFIRGGLTFSQGPELIYLQRDESLFRRLKNRNNLLIHLQEMGFKVINPEKLTLEEQLFFFNSAKIVVAESGAALTNIIFMNPGASVVEIHPGNAKAGLWESLGQIFGVTVEVVYGSPLRVRNFLANDSSFKVDIQKIELVVKKLIKQISSG